MSRSEAVGTARAEAYPVMSAIFCVTRGSSSLRRRAPSMTSDRSIVLTLIPDSWRSFSLYRVVLKAFGRAPMAPILAFRRPFTTRQTPRNFVNSSRNAGEFTCTVWRSVRL